MSPQKTELPLTTFLAQKCLDEHQHPCFKEDHCTIDDANKDYYLDASELKRNGQTVSQETFQSIYSACRFKYPRNVYMSDPVWAPGYKADSPDFNSLEFHIHGIEMPTQYYVVNSRLGTSMEGHSIFIWIKKEEGREPVVESAYGYYSKNMLKNNQAIFGPDIDHLSPQELYLYRLGLEAHIGPVDLDLAQDILKRSRDTIVIRMNEQAYDVSKQALQEKQYTTTKVQKENCAPSRIISQAPKAPRTKLHPCDYFAEPFDQAVLRFAKVLLKYGYFQKDPPISDKDSLMSFFKDYLLWAYSRANYPSIELDKKQYLIISPQSICGNLLVRLLNEEDVSLFYGAFDHVSNVYDMFSFNATQFKPGDHYTGEMKNGVPHGKGKIVYQNPIFYASKYGFGKNLWYSYEGDFVDGYPQGEGVVVTGEIDPYLKQAPRIEGHFEHGQYHGKVIEYNIYGEKHIEGTYYKGMPHGEFIYYRTNNQVMLRTQYVMGRQNEASETVDDHDVFGLKRGTFYGNPSTTKNVVYVSHTRQYTFPNGDHISIYGNKAIYQFSDGKILMGSWGFVSVGQIRLDKPQIIPPSFPGDPNMNEDFYGECVMIDPLGNTLAGQYSHGKITGDAVFILNEPGYLNTGEKQNVHLRDDGSFEYITVTKQEPKKKTGIARFFERIGESLEKRAKAFKQYVKSFTAPDLNFFKRVDRCIGGGLEFYYKLHDDAIKETVSQIDHFLKKNPELAAAIAAVSMAKQAQDVDVPPVVTLPQPIIVSNTSAPKRYPAGQYTVLVPAETPTGVSVSDPGAQGSNIVDAIHFNLGMLYLHTAANISQENDTQLRTAINAIAKDLNPNQELSYDVYYENGYFSTLIPSGIPVIKSPDAQNVGTVVINGSQYNVSQLGSPNITVSPEERDAILKYLQQIPGVDFKKVEEILKK